MKPKEIQKLIEIVEKSDIHELEVSRWGKRVRISKPSAVSVAKSSADSVALSSAPPPIQPLPAITTPAPIATVETPAPAKAADPNVFEVKSPMVGTLYRAPAPDAAPYVQVGDIVSQNQVLCIIEAMKLMNEIETEVRGRIVEILVENAQPVEYNQVLFKLEKL